MNFHTVLSQYIRRGHGLLRHSPVVRIVFLFLFLFFSYAELARAATNISPNTTEHWAWSDLIGWIDFYNTNSIVVSDSQLTGYANSSVGDISLDCATTRNGNICPLGQSDPRYYRVTNDGAGNLSRWGWNDAVGWVSFDCANHGCGISYRVYIDPSGYFHNYAWNDVVGWISFNCNDPNPPTGICGISNYKVVTSWTSTSTMGWLESSTFDTEVPAGAQINSVLWQGNQPVATTVKFQFAASNSSSGPWVFSGTDGTSNTYYDPMGPNSSLKLDYSLYNNKRYFRYKVFLTSNSNSTISPSVDDILINWSP